jgi:hypothetical protein
MPRHKQTDRPVNKKLSLRQSVVEQVDAALVDPLTKKPEFGSWSEVIEALLEGWLDGRFKIHKDSYSTNLKDLIDG